MDNNDFVHIAKVTAISVLVGMALISLVKVFEPQINKAFPPFVIQLPE